VESVVVDPDKDLMKINVPTFPNISCVTDPRDPLDYKAIGIPDHAMIEKLLNRLSIYDYAKILPGTPVQMV
jgi:hypothetical protein